MFILDCQDNIFIKTITYSSVSKAHPVKNTNLLLYLMCLTSKSNSSRFYY